MVGATEYEERARRLAVLQDDILNGRIKMDTLVNSAISFEGETRAMYYSNAIRNMQSITADAVMSHNQQLNDLDCLKQLRERGFYGKK